MRVAAPPTDQRMLPAGTYDYLPAANASRGDRALWLAEWIYPKLHRVAFSRRCFRLAGMQTIGPLRKLKV